MMTDAALNTEGAMLSIRDLSLVIPGRARPLFDNLQLEVHSGENVVIVGGSGTGKSTLAAKIFGLDTRLESSGFIEREPNAVLLLQEGAVFDHLSVGGNLKVVLNRAGRPSKDADLRVLLAKVNLDDLALSKPAHALSGGQKRRLALARALATDPRLFYFDEPSAGLDIDNVRDQAVLIRSLCTGTDRSAIIVTHDTLLAAMAADRVLILEDGILKEVAQFERQADELKEEEIERRKSLIERGIEGRLKVPLGQSDDVRPGLPARIKAEVAKLGDSLLMPGDLLLELIRVLRNLGRSLRHTVDFLSIFVRSFWMAGVSGSMFYGLIGAILGAIIMVVLKLASPLPFEQALGLVQGTFIGALTPPIMGFLFAARSGSAITAWLGGMVYSRQVDAMKTLNVHPDAYLRVPVWLGTILGYVTMSALFVVAMWFGAGLTASNFFGVPGAYSVLAPTLSDPELSQAIVKLPIYAVILATVITRVGLETKYTSEDVAKGITRAIIVSTVLVTLAELVARIPALAM
jgi:ABC-type nitrate/sulfonate/bicarbonate transport system ATPase subunit/ABC-type transporter Mla maintaining outer membrane lipid asymmetry permease subunit MlaE